MLSRELRLVKPYKQESQEENPSLDNMGEGFINWGYIVGKKNSMLDMKGLSFPMTRVFDYLGYMACLSRA